MACCTSLPSCARPSSATTPPPWSAWASWCRPSPTSPTRGMPATPPPRPCCLPRRSDFFDLHAYIGGELSLDEYAENFGVQERITAPLIMGKTGALGLGLRHGRAGRRRGAGLDRRLVQLRLRRLALLGLCALPSHHRRRQLGLHQRHLGLHRRGWLPAAGHLAAQPAGCLPDHRAAGAQPGSRAGGDRLAELPTEPASQAVDGSAEQWGAGAFPEQWLMIDLGAPSTIGSIRLLVGQWPAGRTVHQLYAARRGRRHAPAGRVQ